MGGAVGSEDVRFAGGEERDALLRAGDPGQ